MGRPPEVSPGAASALVLRLFPFKHVSLDSFKQLPSYDDRNIYFEGIHEDKTELTPFVLKMSNTDLYTLELVDGLSKMMLFVESRGFVCSAPIASRTGQHSLMATEQELLGGKRSDGGEEVEAVEYPVRVMRYIPGELMDKLDKCYLTPQLSYDVGNYVGRMDQALQVYILNVYRPAPCYFNLIFCRSSIIEQWKIGSLSGIFSTLQVSRSTSLTLEMSRRERRRTLLWQRMRPMSCPGCPP